MKTEMQELEITPEMLEAGLDVLLNYEHEKDDPKLTLRWIFEEMLKGRDVNGPRNLR